MTVCFILLSLRSLLVLKPHSHYKRHTATKRHDPIHFNGELAISGDKSDSGCQQPLATGWGVSSDATKFRIPQLYANEERLLGATANRKEDGRAHVIVLLSAVDKHTQWKKSRLRFAFIFVCMYGFNLYLYYI